ncbi:hypothetical protein D3C79_977320 [compost metagenome]
MNTTKPIIATASKPIATRAKMLISPVRADSKDCPIALGRPATIPAKINIEIPLPTPRSVICSPSHIMNIAPATKVETATTWKPRPTENATPWLARPMDMPMA